MSISSMRDTLFRTIEHLLELTGAIILVALMMLTAVDVVARYAFNAPIRGAFELTELTLAVLIFAGLPLVSRAQEHIVVDLLEQRMGRSVRAVLGRAANLICGAVLLGLSKLLWTKAGRTAEAGDYTSVLQVAYAPFVYMMAVLVVVAGLVHLAYCIRPPQPRAGLLDGNV